MPTDDTQHELEEAERLDRLVEELENGEAQKYTKRSHGAMCSINQAIEYLSKLEDKDNDMPIRIVNRLQYIKDKENGAPVKYHKGTYGRKYDWWTCGNCGTVLRHDVGDNYCWNCGYFLKWGSPRCLTGISKLPAN